MRFALQSCTGVVERNKNSFLNSSPTQSVFNINVLSSQYKLVSHHVLIPHLYWSISALKNRSWTISGYQILVKKNQKVDIENHFFLPTCSHKQDPSSQDDVPLALVEAAGGHADSAQQQQDGAEDGEDAGGSHHTWQRRDGAAASVEDSDTKPTLLVSDWTLDANVNERAWQDDARRHLKVRRRVTLWVETCES